MACYRSKQWLESCRKGGGFIINLGYIYVLRLYQPDLKIND